MDFIPKKIEEYSILHTTKENQLLAKLNRETWDQVMIPRMISGHLQGRLLSMYSKMLAPKNILEIGTYTGYSALCLAEGLAQNGKLHTIDHNEEVTSFSRKYFELSDYKNNIVQHLGNALEIISKIDVEFQLVFIDADKENYCNYYNLVMEKLTVGGYIIADNVLWSGKVLNPNEEDTETQALRAFNQRIQEDNRVENILLPIRDGLMLCRKLLH